MDAPAAPIIPKVFISYTHDSSSHEDAVLAISDKLRGEQIDAAIDQYEQNPPEGWFVWMQRQIESADFVLLVCTQNYRKRLEKNEEPGIGLGALWEGQIIYATLYNLQGNNSKFIPVILKNEDCTHIPAPLQSATRYNVGSEHGYDELYARLTRQHRIAKPPLGNIRTLPPKKRILPSRVDSATNARAEVVLAALFSEGLPDQPANEVVHDNYHHTIATLSKNPKIDVVALEGQEGIGKTTLLAQFVRRVPDSCMSLFLSPDDRTSYDPDNVRLSIVKQASWMLDRTPYAKASIDQEHFQEYLDRLQPAARRRREPTYILIDGLQDLLPRQTGVARRLLELLPACSMDGFNYIVTGDVEELRAIFPSHVTLKSFQLVGFGFEDTVQFFDGILTDRDQLRDLHRLSSGNPARLSSARRLVLRGMKVDELLTLTATGRAVFDVEWSLLHHRNDDFIKRLLAHLAFDDKRTSLSELANTLQTPAETVADAVSSLTVLSVSSRTDTVDFRNRWFRAQAQKELYMLRKGVHKNIAQQLLQQSEPLGRLLDVPLHYSEADDYEKVLLYLSNEHFIEIIQKAQSINRVQRAVQLGLAAAKQLDKTGELLRFGLDSAILNDFFGFGFAISEVTALAELRDYKSALAIARSTSLKEDRLHLLAIVARRKAQHKDAVEPELLQQLTALANEVDPQPLGRRMVDICVELSAVLPDVALNFADKTQPEHRDRTRLLAGVSLMALEAGEERSHAAFERMRKDHDRLPIELMQKAVTATAGKWTADEVLLHSGKFERARERLFVLRSWTKAKDHKDDSGRVIEHALNAAIAATDYTVDATVLRELAEGLAHVSDVGSVRKLVEMFDAQRGAAAKLGPSVDYVRLEILLAEAEALFDPIEAETRLLKLFYDVLGYSDQQIRALCWAWFIRGIKHIASGTYLQAHGALLEDSLRELEETFVSLLDATADHYRSAGQVIEIV